MSNSVIEHDEDQQYLEDKERMEAPAVDLSAVRNLQVLQDILAVLRRTEQRYEEMAMVLRRIESRMPAIKREIEIKPFVLELDPLTRSGDPVIIK